MADLGAITEIVNASELTLGIGATPNIWIMLTNLVLHIGRTEDRIATTDGGALYAYGKGENFFTCTLVLTGPEWDGTAFTNATTAASFNELTQVTTDGDMNELDWLIRASDVSGTTKVATCTGVLREYDIRKNESGLVEIDIFVRITGDTISIT